MKVLSLFLLAGVSAFLVAGKLAGSTMDGEIVCFGDSITYGARVEGHSWVYFLSLKHRDLRFINAGRNGRKTSDREELLPVLRKYKGAAAFLILLGVNDLKDGNDTMVSRCAVNVRWMIREIKRASPASRIVLLSPARINLNKMSPSNVRKKYNENTERSLAALDAEYRLLARSESVGFISLLDAVSPPHYVDGLHPDEAGQQEIASAVWEGFNRLLHSGAKQGAVGR